MYTLTVLTRTWST